MKTCPECGNQGRCTDSRQAEEFTRRRYVCGCGHRWTTAEFLVHEGGRRGARGTVETFIRKAGQKAAAKLAADFQRAIAKATRF